MWCHPEISLPSFIPVLRAFLDMLILASGCQSDGKPAYWSSDDVRRALGWASFIEEVLKRLPISWDGRESRQALDLALLDLMANVNYPPGLPKLSVEVLVEARKLLINTFIQAAGIGNGQVNSLLTAVAVCEDQDVELNKNGNGLNHWLWDYSADQILLRYSAFSCMKMLLSTLDVTARTFSMPREVTTKTCKIWKENLQSSIESDLTEHERDACCQSWKQKSLSYLFNTKTLYRLSGAAVIFQASEAQWRQMLASLQGFEDDGDENKRVRIAELCCLQLASPKWSDITKTVLKFCCKACFLSLMPNFSHLRIQDLKFKGHASSIIQRRSAVEDYLQELLLGRENLLWRLPPILVASSLYPGSSLFSRYLAELSRHIDTTSISTRCLCFFHTRNPEIESASKYEVNADVDTAEAAERWDIIYSMLMQEVWLNLLMIWDLRLGRLGMHFQQPSLLGLVGLGNKRP